MTAALKVITTIFRVNVQKKHQNVSVVVRGTIFTAVIDIPFIINMLHKLTTIKPHKTEVYDVLFCRCRDRIPGEIVGFSDKSFQKASACKRHRMNELEQCDQMDQGLWIWPDKY